MSKLNHEEREALKATGIFGDRPETLCKDCGGYHLRACPRIKREIYLGNGNRTEVEYWQQWDESSVIFIDDVYDDDEEENA